MSESSFDVALCQYGLAGVSTAAELCARAADLFDRAGPADLFVLPELFAYDLTLDDAGDDQYLTGADLETVHEFVATEAEARDAIVVGGTYRTTEDGSLYNRAPIGLPDGSLETYEKGHPIPMERDMGTVRGTEPGPVFEHRGVAVGVLVCYDVEFPAAVAAVADAGAEVLAVPSLTASEAGFQRVGRCSAARAVENQLYVAQVPLVGDHPRGDKTGTGRGTIYGPCDDVVGADGTGLTLPRDEHTAATQSLDVDALRTSRERASVRPYTDRAYFAE